MLPQEFLDRMQVQLKEEYPQYLASLERPRAVALRLNPLKKRPRQLPFLQAPVAWEPEGFYYDPEARPGLHPYHEAGVYYLQEASAMAPVVLLEPQPGERICDLCAAPGGKSTQIAGRLMGQGLLLCNEIHPKRARILSRNIERLGIANALVTNEHPQRLAEKLPGYFHRVLVDAPCSGEGMFRKEEAAVTNWSVDTVRMCANRQAEILESAARLLMPGGRLVYSTCTFAPEENEETVARFLARHPEFTPELSQAPWFTPGPNGSYRLWPHRLLGEGHFLAVLKKAEGEEEPVPQEPGQKLPKLWQEFARQLDIHLPRGIAVQFGDSLFWAPEMLPSLKGLKVLRPGLELGELKKDRFEPAHALALWLQDGKTTWPLAADDGQLAAYMNGQTIPAPVRGWCQITVDGYGIGWGKGDGKVLKNHYPKGLRR